MIPINKKILQLCEERGWSNYELAQHADIPQTTVNSAINRDSAPKIDTLQRICDAFGITLSQFFFESESHEILSDYEKKLVDLYRILPLKKQRALLDLLENDLICKQ